MNLRDFCDDSRRLNHQDVDKFHQIFALFIQEMDNSEPVRKKLNRLTEDCATQIITWTHFNLSICPFSYIYES